jgi:hypothetical protein
MHLISTNPKHRWNLETALLDNKLVFRICFKQGVITAFRVNFLDENKKSENQKEELFQLVKLEEPTINRNELQSLKISSAAGVIATAKILDIKYAPPKELVIGGAVRYKNILGTFKLNGEENHHAKYVHRKGFSKALVIDN